jgi:hypothetical protein
MGKQFAGQGGAHKTTGARDQDFHFYKVFEL